MRLPLNRYTISQGYRPGHQAFDLTSPQGTPSYATVTGAVVTVGTNPNYIGGRFIIVRADSDGYKHYTGHHSRTHVVVGQRVSEGQHIADVGATGQATGPHVHFQVRNTSGTLVPESYYAPLFKKGDPPMSPQEENEAYQIVLERPMEHSGSGRSGIAFMRDARTELGVKRTAATNHINSLNQRIAEIQTAIESLSSRPTKEEYAAVQAQINDKVIELAALKKKLEEEQAKKTEDTQLLDDTRNIFQRIIDRIFKR